MSASPVHVFTDVAESTTAKSQSFENMRLVMTGCGAGHLRQHLCCKMAAELTYYLRFSHAQWFCHFDDDTYVHVRNLASLLAKHPWWRAWYLGKPSLRRPIEVMDRKQSDGTPVHVWFATGGAGFCLSQFLVYQLEPLIRRQGFQQTCARCTRLTQCSFAYVGEHVIGLFLRIRLPDDCTWGTLCAIVWTIVSLSYHTSTAISRCCNCWIPLSCVVF